MKYLKNRSIRASALHVALSIALLFGFAIVFTSLKAAGPAAVDRAQPSVVAQPGFYPPLPNGVGPTCTPIEVHDHIGSPDVDPKEVGRITPTGDQSACGASNPCAITPGMFQYRQYTFTNNTGEERCITATLATGCNGATALFAAAYAGSFNPANPCTNLVGDTGIVSQGFPIPFGFTVPAGATFVMVVNETTENAGCFAFKLFIEGLCGQPSPTPTATATFTPTPTATATFTPTPTATATFTPTPTATATFTPTPTATATFTPTPTPTATVPMKVSQLTPTNVTCDQFLSGTAPSLSEVEYSLKGTPPKINQVDPGVFFYWVRFTAVAGSNTVMVNESITSGNFSALFTFQSGSNVFNLDCESQHPTITQAANGTVSLTFNAPSAGTYVALVKYSANSVKGNLAPTPGTTVHYQFNTTGVANSTEDLDMIKKPNSD